MAKAPSHKKNWPADKIERRPVDSLTPYAKNARTHSDAQVAQIAASIKEYGFTVPVLIDPAGNVIAGHGRLMAAKLAGLADVPVMIADGWSASKRRAYVILDNKLALNSGWDADILRSEFAELAHDGFDLGELGFDPIDLSKIMKEPAESDASPQLDGLTYSVVVTCKDEADQGKLLEQFEADGLTCKALIS